MIELQDPRIVPFADTKGTSHSVKVDNIVTLGDALSAADIFAPTWMKIGVGWESDTLAQVAAAYVSGPYFMPSAWEVRGDSLGFGMDTSDAFFRCSDGQMDDDIDCGLINRIGLLQEASGVIIALGLDKGQAAETLSEIGEVYLRIDVDNNTPDGHGNPVFVPLMSMKVDLSKVEAPATVIAGLFVGSNMRYDIPPLADEEIIDSKSVDLEGPHYYDLNAVRSQTSLLQLRALSSHMATSPVTMEYLGLMN